MKKTIVALVAIAIVGSASADILAAFSVGFGIGGNGAGGGIVEPIQGTEMVFQLINGGGDGLDLEAGNTVTYDAVAGEFLVSGNDSVIGTLTAAVTADPGTDFSDYASNLGGLITAPWVADTWIRVSGIQQGDWVWSSAQPLANLDLGANPPPEGIFYDNGGAGSSADGSVTVNVVPEPATIGLMGIAGLGMFLARRKARR